MNPIMLVVGAGALLVVLYLKGYLGIADAIGLGLAAPAKGNLMPKATSTDLFAKGVKMAMEEAHEEVAAKMAADMRDRVVQAHVLAFPGSGPSAQPAPDAAIPVAPSAS